MHSTVIIWPTLYANMMLLYVTATNKPHYAVQSICQSVTPSGLICENIPHDSQTVKT